MMTRKFIIVICTFFCFITNPISAQVKTDCEPSSCGPGNTKVGEAKVITELRNDLHSIIEEMSKSGNQFSSEVKDFSIKKGDSDEESLLYLNQATNVIKSQFLKIAPDKLIPSISENPILRPQTKQEIILTLIEEVELLKTQMKSLK